MFNNIPIIVIEIWQQPRLKYIYTEYQTEQDELSETLPYQVEDQWKFTYLLRVFGQLKSHAQLYSNKNTALCGHAIYYIVVVQFEADRCNYNFD